MVTSPFSLWLQGKHATVGGDLSYPIVLNPLGGNVGIGITSPTVRLHVSGSSIITNPNPGANSAVLLVQDEGTATTVKDGTTLRVVNNGSAADFSVFEASSAVSNFVILNNGNVGIGSSSPAAKLDIVGTNSAIALSFGTTVPNNPLFINTYAGSMGIGMDQTTAGIRLAGDYSAGSNPLVDIGYYSSATVSHANWVSRLKVINNGNVGIGTASPTTLLSVGGAGSTAAASGLTFGGDASANLYRISSSRIKTDGSLEAAVGIISPTVTSLSGNIAATGSTLDTKINTLSGYSNATFATITNLAATGSVLDTKINTLSGYSNSTFATITNLAVTGSTLDTKINTTNTNLAATGSTLDTKINTLSGYSNATFATITNLAATGSVLDTKINTLSGYSNANFATILNLAATGSTLDTKINTLSGYSNANFATILNLAATGSTLDTKINTTNTNLAATGSTLDTKINTLSGYSNANFATILNLAATGSTLNARINSLSGYASSTFLSGQGVANWTARWNGTKELITGSIYDLGTGIGIGTTSPTSRLTVVQSVGTDSVLLDLQSNNDPGIRFGRSTFGSLIRHITATTDYIAFNCNGTSLPSVAATAQVVFDENGNVGIGTTSPLQKLQVDGVVGSPASVGVTQSGIFRISNTTDNAVLDFGIRIAGSGAWIQSTDETSLAANYPLLLNPNGGNVGIGTLVPADKLHVIGNIRINGGDILNWGGQAFIQTIGANDMFFRPNSTLRMILTAVGNLGLGVLAPATLLSVGGAGSTSAASGITFGADSQANLYRISSSRIKTDGNFTIDGQGGGATSLVLNRSSTSSENGMAFNTAGVTDWYFYVNDATSNLQIQRLGENDATPRVRFDGSNSNVLFNLGGGNVGIGTAQPTGKLHVVSSIAGETVLRADGTNGTLFSVVDDLSDSLMSVNNSAGLPVLEVFADDRVVAGQYGSGDFVLVNNKVGIGTSNPSYKLDVNGSLGINASTSDTNWPFVVSDNSSAGSRYGLNKVGSMGFNHADAYAQLQLLGTNGAYIDFTNSVGGDSNARLIYYAGNRLDLTYGFISKGTISLNSNGVGIGTTNPLWALDVSGTAIRSFASGAVEPGFIADYASSNGYGGFFVHADGTRKWRIAVVGDTNASPALSVWQEGVGARMSFRNNGNVGVGTTLPDTKLSIGVASDSALGTSSDGLRITDGTRNVQLLRNGTGYNYAGVVGSGSMLYSYDRMHIVADTANPILFHTNGAERVRIGPDGNVGIGVTNPTNTLQVNGQIAIKGNESADNVKIHIQASDNSNRYTIKTDLDGTTTNDLLIFRSNTVDNMLVLKGNGNIGIGTTIPDAKLSINKGATNQLLALNMSNDTIKYSLYVDQDNNGSNSFSIFDTTNSQTAIKYLPTGNGSWQLYTNNVVRLHINNVGNVGIGVTTPATKLEVYGVLRVSESASGGILQLTAGASIIDIASTFYGGSRRPITFTMDSEKVRIAADGKFGIGIDAPTTLLSVGPVGSTLPASGLTFGGDASANLYRSAASTIKTDGNLVVAGTTSLNGHIYGNKTVTLTTASYTTVLTVNLTSHTSCYVKIGAFGDWSNHSAVAFASELFIQNGDNAYNTPGTIITAHDNTAGAAGDKIDIQIVDPLAAGTQNFLIQLKLISATSSTNSSLITYHVMGQQASVT